jgi:hypothetical protein
MHLVFFVFLDLADPVARELVSALGAAAFLPLIDALFLL